MVVKPGFGQTRKRLKVALVPLPSHFAFLYTATPASHPTLVSCFVRSLPSAGYKEDFPRTLVLNFLFLGVGVVVTDPSKSCMKSVDSLSR